MLFFYFMSKIRQYPNSSNFTNFGQAIQTTISSIKKVCLAARVYIVFDSYCKLSVKKRKRIRGARDTGGTTDVISLSEAVLSTKIG